MHRVILADDQAIFRAGVARLLAGQKHARVIAQCEDYTGTLEAAAANRSYTLVLSESLATKPERILAAVAAADARLVLLVEDPESLPKALLGRLDGIIVRRSTGPALLECLKRIGSGERLTNRTLQKAIPDPPVDQVLTTLTRRELQIVGFIVRGCKNREIAEELRTKEQVIKNRLRIIFEKTGVHDRFELALFALHNRAVGESAAREADALQAQQQK